MGAWRWNRVSRSPGDSTRSIEVAFSSHRPGINFSSIKFDRLQRRTQFLWIFKTVKLYRTAEVQNLKLTPGR